MSRPLSTTTLYDASVRPAFRSRADDVFFPIMALAVAAIVIAGFSQSFFFAGLVLAPLPNALVRVHGTVFVLWIALLVVQTSLVPARKIALHKRLGLAGAFLLPLLFIFGTLTLVDSIRRNGVPIPPEILLAGDLEELSLFTGLTLIGLLRRADGATHKRLMLLGTMAMLGPAIDRLHFGIAMALGIYAGLPLLVAVYDLCVRRKLHRATAAAWAAIAISGSTLFPIAQLPLWHQLVALIRA